MKQSTKRLVSSAIALVLILGGFAVFFNLLQPAYGELISLRGELIAREGLATHQEEVVEQVKKIVSSYDNGLESQKVIDQVLPGRPELANAIGQVNGLLRLNSLLPQSFGISTTNPQPSTPVMDERGVPQPALSITGKLILKIRATGSYEDFKKFLQALETNIRLMDVDELAIIPADKVNPSNYTFDFTITAYYQQ